MEQIKTEFRMHQQSHHSKGDDCQSRFINKLRGILLHSKNPPLFSGGSILMVLPSNIMIFISR